MIWFIVCFVGLLINMVGSILLLVAGFKTSVGWGLALIFIPGAALVFMFKHWDRAQVGVATCVAGWVLAYLGVWRLGSVDLTTEDWGPLDEVRVALVEQANMQNNLTGNVPADDPGQTDSWSSTAETSDASAESRKKTAKGKSFLSPILKSSEKDETTSDRGIPEPAEAESSVAVSSDQQWVGKTIDQVTSELGEPTVRVSRGRQKVLIYDRLELVSEDGVTITSQSVDK